MTNLLNLLKQAKQEKVEQHIRTGAMYEIEPTYFCDYHDEETDKYYRFRTSYDSAKIHQEIVFRFICDLLENGVNQENIQYCWQQLLDEANDAWLELKHKAIEDNINPDSWEDLQDNYDHSNIYETWYELSYACDEIAENFNIQKYLY